MSDSVYIGRRCASVSKPPPLKPISKVVLWIDDEHCYEAGDDTGREQEVFCPYGSQRMAEALLQKLTGYAYAPMTAEDALLDPAAELGDAVTVDGLYTVMASVDWKFDGLLAGDISAPGAVELAQEYQFSNNEKVLNRKIARNRSLIAKTADEIRWEVSQTIGDLGEYETVVSAITQTAESIKEEVNGYFGTDEDGNTISVSSSIALALGEIALDVSNGEDSSTITLKVGETVIDSKEIKMTGVVTFSGLESGETTINGGWIETDSIYADAMHLGGSLAVYKYLASDDVGGFLGYDSGFNSDSGIGIRNADGLAQVVCTDDATRISYGINPYWGITQVVCRENTLTLEGYSLIQFKTDSVVRMGLDGISLYPADASITLGEPGLYWADVYAAGTSFSALVARVEALEKK